MCESIGRRVSSQEIRCVPTTGVVESGSCTPPALELSLEVIAARARPSGLSSLHPWTSQSNLLCYHPNRMIFLRLDGCSIRSLSHAHTDPESMLQLTLSRPVLRTTFTKRDSSESYLICSADIRLSIHPQVCRKDPETQTEIYMSITSAICSRELRSGSGT